MLTFLKTAAAIFAMTLVVLIAVVAMSSSWKEGLRAWGQYMKIMGSIYLVAGVISGAYILLSML